MNVQKKAMRRNAEYNDPKKTEFDQTAMRTAFTKALKREQKKVHQEGTSKVVQNGKMST